MTLKRQNIQATESLMEQVVINGDLATLSPGQRVDYYKLVCESLGLNPLTAPFAYIKLNNKLTLYAKRDCTDQLRALHGISTTITSREVTNEVYVVTAKASTPEGRSDESIGAVPINNLKGEFLANAYMKAETKSKRRVTLSIVGLGWLDETEVGSILEAEVVPVDHATGEIVPQQPQLQPAKRPTVREARTVESAQASAPSTCEIHGLRMGLDHEGHRCHRLKDGTFCFGGVTGPQETAAATGDAGAVVGDTGDP